MPWIISFIISWIIFLSLADKKRLKRNIWGGLMALALGSVVDYGGQQLKLYEFYQLVIPLAGCSVFYKLGPVFTMGVLFCQHVPSGKWLQAISILGTSVIYAMLELCIVSTGVATYIHWNILASLVVDIMAFTSLTWFTLAFLREKQL